MQHRHLNPATEWSLSAIDSALDRGSVPEWRQLFDAARRNRGVAERILIVARHHPMRGVLPIAEHVLLAAWPDLKCNP